jgi:hypothetical protein
MDDIPDTTLIESALPYEFDPAVAAEVEEVLPPRNVEAKPREIVPHNVSV